MIKIKSWNVNGIRSCAKKTFFNWLHTEDADIVCVQETKAHPDQFEQELLGSKAYSSTWDSAEKRGYSGVANFHKTQPLRIEKGIGEKKFDVEGRTITFEYPQFYLINAYFPNGQRDHARVPFKMEYCKIMAAYCQSLLAKGKELVICGDFNTAHKSIDLRNPTQNKNTTGFLPIERQWLDEFSNMGFVDIFRKQHPEPHQYTWWSYRPGVRQRNIGWRIDYFFISPGLENRVQSTYHQNQIFGSDHCPIGLILDI